jgi:hypothetical protein
MRLCVNTKGLNQSYETEDISPVLIQPALDCAEDLRHCSQ